MSVSPMITSMHKDNLPILTIQQAKSSKFNPDFLETTGGDSMPILPSLSKSLLQKMKPKMTN